MTYSLISNLNYIEMFQNIFAANRRFHKYLSSGRWDTPSSDTRWLLSLFMANNVLSMVLLVDILFETSFLSNYFFITLGLGFFISYLINYYLELKGIYRDNDNISYWWMLYFPLSMVLFFWLAVLNS